MAGTLSSIPPTRASALFVVFDSNIWISQRGLKSARGIEAKNHIWANCLELLEEADVCLVTGDKAFFKDRDYNNGLAPDLAKEEGLRPHTLRLFSRLEDLLQDADRDVARVIPEST